MSQNWQAEYQEKQMTPQEAVKLVKSGDTVYIGTASTVAYALSDALADRVDELEDLTIASALVVRPTELYSREYAHPFRVNSYFLGGQERALQKRGLLDFTSVNLSEVDIWCKKTAKPNVAFFEVSPPDENGYMSYSSNGVAMHSYIREVAETIVLQVNRNAPYVYGEYNLIHVSEASAIVEADTPLSENVSLEVDGTIQTISDYLLEQIPDGACIQLGLGGVADAVGRGLRTRNDLGAHTELITDTMMDLMKLGVLNNSRKNIFQGKAVAGFAFGSKELYRYLDKNPAVYFLPFPIVNDPVNIGKNDNMISVNTAISIDLMGQVCADNIAGRQHSGIGGQVDYVRGAQMSKGGKSFIAVTSTVENKKLGKTSRIVSCLPDGAAVTTSRADVQYVVTEFGCVNLKELTMRDRVRAMIQLAHPDFRPQLTEDAKRAGIL